MYGEICVNMYIYIHTYKHVYTYVCIFFCTYIYIHMYTYIYTHACVPQYVYTYMFDDTIWVCHVEATHAMSGGHYVEVECSHFVLSAAQAAAETNRSKET